MGVDAEISEDPRRLRPKDSEVLRLCCDATRLRERTGWQPGCTREQGLQQTIEWLRRPGNLARYYPDEYNQ
jgi:nucleoside-diphosphate-sugar epimerase